MKRPSTKKISLVAPGLIKEKRQKNTTSVYKQAHKKRSGISSSSGSSGAQFYISQDPSSCKRILPEVKKKHKRQLDFILSIFSATRE